MLKVQFSLLCISTFINNKQQVQYRDRNVPAVFAFVVVFNICMILTYRNQKFTFPNNKYEIPVPFRLRWSFG